MGWFKYIFKINNLFKNYQCRKSLGRFSVIYVGKMLMNHSRYLTKEIIVSDNVALRYCVSLYLLIHIIIYIYIFVKNWCVKLSATTSEKIYHNLVLPFSHIYCTQKRKHESATSAHLVQPLSVLPAKILQRILR